MSIEPPSISHKDPSYALEPPVEAQLSRPDTLDPEDVRAFRAQTGILKYRSAALMSGSLFVDKGAIRGRGLQGRGRGSNKGPITVPQDVSGLRKSPSVPPDSNGLPTSNWLSRQRSRVRAPSSPPFKLKNLSLNGILSGNPQSDPKFHCTRRLPSPTALRNALCAACFSSRSSCV